MSIESIFKGAWLVRWLDEYGTRHSITYYGMSRNQAIERAIHDYGLKK